MGSMHTYMHVLLFKAGLIQSYLTCDENQWECQDGRRCIQYKNVCDGFIHCRDGSDENKAFCLHWECPEHMWKCRNNQCISEEHVCDKAKRGNDVNCKDQSDEEIDVCRNWTCTPGRWKCLRGMKY